MVEDRNKTIGSVKEKEDREYPIKYNRGKKQIEHICRSMDCCFTRLETKNWKKSREAGWQFHRGYDLMD